MNLNDLQAMGAFASSKPVLKTITLRQPVLKPEKEWDDPDVAEFTGEDEEVTMDVLFKPFSSADEIQIARASDEDKGYVAIQRSVLNDDGTLLFQSLDEVKLLNTWMLVPLIKAVEGLAVKKSNAMPLTNSG